MPSNFPLPALSTTGPVAPLPVERLYRHADVTALAFTTTADIAPADVPVGQRRALDAIRFGAEIERSGFNLFAIGSPAAGMRQAVEAVLKHARKDRHPPSDWVYVNNFQDPQRPTAIDLPPGRARQFHDAMHEVIDDLKTAIPAVFESENYQTRRGAIDEAFHKTEADSFAVLRDKAGGEGRRHCADPSGVRLGTGAQRRGDPA